MSRLVLLLSLVLISTVPSGYAQVDCSLPAPWTVTRTNGAPVFETLSFTTCGGSGTLVVENSGSASAVVMLNGVQLMAPSDFHSGQDTVAVPVHLIKGGNVLSVQLRGKPGSKLTFTVVQIE